MGYFFTKMCGMVVIGLVVFILSNVEAIAEEKQSNTFVALLNDRVPADRIQIVPTKKKHLKTASFCGACKNSNHGACGGQSNGWSCCSDGCTGGTMKCWQVVSCDKISAVPNQSYIKVALGDLLAESAKTKQAGQKKVASYHCTYLYNEIEAERASYEAQCFGELTQSQYDHCRYLRDRLNDKVARYNHECT
ncbi:MAG: hypothetical protein AAF478_06985 [Pseudomonadota bacterium]